MATSWGRRPCLAVVSEREWYHRVRVVQRQQEHHSTLANHHNVCHLRVPDMHASPVAPPQQVSKHTAHHQSRIARCAFKPVCIVMRCDCRRRWTVTCSTRLRLRVGKHENESVVRGVGICAPADRSRLLPQRPPVEIKSCALTVSFS